MSNKATRVAYGESLRDLGDKYDFVVLDADLSKATQTCLFKEIYPARFFNFGIAEQDMFSTAAGLASCNKVVFASTFAMFAAGRSYEQIRNSIAYSNLNVKIGATHGGVLIGEDGASHQCIEDIGLMRNIPNMTVIVPSDEYMTYKAVEAAINKEGPVYLRFGRTSSPSIYDENLDYEIGKGNIIYDGTDLAIFACGDMVFEAKKAAEELITNGLSIAVIDMHTIKPLDKELVIHYINKVGKLVTVEDHSIIGGLGSAISEVIADTGKGKLTRIGINDKFGQSGSRNDVQKAFGLESENIKTICKEIMKA